MILYEYRRFLKRGTKEVILLPQQDLTGLQGFRSVYGFPDGTSRFIQDQNSTANLTNCTLYYDALLLDFDNAVEAAMSFEKSLQALGLNYEAYDSGGRSIHFHINTVPKEGAGINKDQAEWVEQHAPGADMSIYRTSSIFRLPGTFHNKYIGRSKVLLRKSEGTLLDVPSSTRKLKQFDFPRSEASADDVEVFLLEAVTTPVRAGTTGRNTHCFKIGSLCRDYGMGFNDAVIMAVKWNNSYANPPIDTASVRSAVASAYKRGSNGQK